MKPGEMDSPVGRQLTTAMRAEALLFERDGKEQAARRFRVQADRMDWMADTLRGQHGRRDTSEG